MSQPVEGSPQEVENQVNETARYKQNQCFRQEVPVVDDYSQVDGNEEGFGRLKVMFPPVEVSPQEVENQVNEPTCYKQNQRFRQPVKVDYDQADDNDGIGRLADYFFNVGHFIGHDSLPPSSRWKLFLKWVIWLSLSVLPGWSLAVPFPSESSCYHTEMH